MATKKLPNRLPPEWWFEKLGVSNTGAENYFVQCPSHSDKGPSLHITMKPGNKDCLIHCFAGCSYAEIVASLESVQSKTVKNEKPSKESEVKESPLEWWASYTGIKEEFWEKLGLDSDESGKYLCFTFSNGSIKARKKGGKDFKWAATGKPPDLWPIPSSPLPKRIYLSEGESDCGILRHLGFENSYALTKGVSSSLPRSYVSGFEALGVEEIVSAFDADDSGDKGRALLSETFEDSTIQIRHANVSKLIPPFAPDKDLRDLFLRYGANLKDKLTKLFEFEESKSPFLSLSARVENLPLIDWLWGGMIPKNTVLLFTGDPKVGKSTLLFKIFGLMKGGGILGARPVSTGRIVYVTEEGNQTLAAKNEVFGPLDNVSVAIAADLIALSWDDMIKMAVRHAREINADTIVIDPFAHFARFDPGEENDASAVLSRIKPLLELRDEFTVILVHHSNKQGATRGSSAIDGAVDGILSMTRGIGNIRTVVSVNRIEESTQILNVDPKTGRESLPLDPKAKVKSENKADLIGWLNENPGKHSAHSIAKATGRPNVRRDLLKLVKAGEVSSEDHPVTGTLFFAKEEAANEPS